MTIPRARPPARVWRHGPAALFYLHLFTNAFVAFFEVRDRGSTEAQVRFGLVASGEPVIVLGSHKR